ncbi:hypothetical protein KBTX_04451 [wastewater metagenome]|uniref:Uncharacterized protein n=2 Tax=unclassified sequences TaxID=12908 RepID=A0A5B8RHE5_9ZZZZ|nr:hypothetical protein KBTEX_04451 [uncultured organism]
MQNHAFWLFVLINIHNAFPKNRLKVEFISGIKIGGNGFGITVNHDGLITHFLSGLHGVYARVVKLNTLTNAVGAAAQNYHFLFIGYFALVFPFVG